MADGHRPTVADPQQVCTAAEGRSLSALRPRAGGPMRCLCNQCGRKFRAEPQQQAADHHLLVGDSTQVADVEKAMAGRLAALFATDPPYLVDYTGADRPNDSGKDWSASYHEIDIRDAEAFLLAVFTNAA